MGHIFYEPTRRDFLRISAASVASLVTLGGCGSSKRRTAAIDLGETHWVFMADTHIPANCEESYNSFYPCENLKKTVGQLSGGGFDGISIAGDLARLEGKLSDYERLKEILTPLAEQTPIFMALGNHDDRKNFYKVFTDLPGERQPATGKHVTVVDTGPVRIIMLDSLMFVNKTPGLLGHAQRKWLGEYLAGNDETPTILCLHHSLADHDGDLLDVPRLFDMVKPIRKVKAIVYGHSHAYRYSEFEGIHLINVPATGYCFGKSAPVGWVEATLTARGGQFKLHAIGGNMTGDKSVTELPWRA